MVQTEIGNRKSELNVKANPRVKLRWMNILLRYKLQNLIKTFFFVLEIQFLEHCSYHVGFGNKSRTRYT